MGLSDGDKESCDVRVVVVQLHSGSLCELPGALPLEADLSLVRVGDEADFAAGLVALGGDDAIEEELAPLEPERDPLVPNVSQKEQPVSQGVSMNKGARSTNLGRQSLGGVSWLKSRVMAAWRESHWRAVRSSRSFQARSSPKLPSVSSAWGAGVGSGGNENRRRLT